MSVLWAGNMRGPRIQTTVSKPVLLLLLLLLSGLTHTVLGQDEDVDTEGEVPEETQATGETEEAPAPEEEDTDPPENGLDTTPIPTVTGFPGTDYKENDEEVGSGGSPVVAAEPLEITTLENGATPAPDDEGLGLLLIIIPVVLVILIVVISVCGVFIHRRRTSKNRHSEVRKEDPYLDGSSTEKVPMPMFEEDVPSVLELEMDELDDWMKKDG